ncbi:unnamed protein product [Gadus morhua 'NCC']
MPRDRNNVYDRRRLPVPPPPHSVKKLMTQQFMGNISPGSISQHRPCPDARRVLGNTWPPWERLAFGPLALGLRAALQWGAAAAWRGGGGGVEELPLYQPQHSARAAPGGGSAQASSGTPDSSDSLRFLPLPGPSITARAERRPRCDAGLSGEPRGSDTFAPAHSQGWPVAQMPVLMVDTAAEPESVRVGAEVDGVGGGGEGEKGESGEKGE